jgi:hypothetical protein
MYLVAIPTYKRHDILQQKTLAMLLKGNVKPKDIFIFVADHEEANTYKKTLAKETYHKIVVGRPGITPQRQFISEYFPKNKQIVSLDDDVEGLYKLHGNGGLKPIENVHEFFTQAFEQCTIHKRYLWGIYPVLNAFYMKPTVTTDLKFILGTCYGYINRPKDQSLKPSLPEKEDFELSILYYLKDGGVLRINNVSIKTKFHNRKGGLGALSQQRINDNNLAALELKRRYPHLGYVWYRKTTGVAEFRLFPRSKSHEDPTVHKHPAS